METDLFGNPDSPDTIKNAAGIIKEIEEMIASEQQ